MAFNKSIYNISYFRFNKNIQVCCRTSSMCKKLTNRHDLVFSLYYLLQNMAAPYTRSYYIQSRSERRGMEETDRIPFRLPPPTPRPPVGEASGPCIPGETTELMGTYFEVSIFLYFQYSEMEVILISFLTCFAGISQIFFFNDLCDTLIQGYIIVTMSWCALAC